MTVSRLKDIPGIGVDKMGQAADDAGNSDMLRLENLDTDLRPPEEALEATLAAIGRDDANSYLPFLGTNDIRRAATSRISATTGQPYDWTTQCVISAGGLSGILNALLAILEPGDVDLWLRGTYDDIVALQTPYDPAKMSVRGPVFPTRRKER